MINSNKAQILNMMAKEVGHPVVYTQRPAGLECVNVETKEVEVLTDFDAVMAVMKALMDNMKP